jgi:hypothetical protein
MSFKRSARLFASAAATAGLAFGGHTLAAPAAQAAAPSATATYTCTNPLGVPTSTFQVPANFSLESLPGALTANVPVPAGTPLVGTLDFSAAGLLPSLIFTLQSSVNMVVSNIPGAEQVATPLNGAFTQISNGSQTVSAQLGSFTPGAGPLPVPIPTSMDFGQLAGPLASLGVHCTLNPGSTHQGGTVTVAKQGARIKAHAKAKGSRAAVVTVKVKTSAGQKGAGTVIAKVKGMKAKSRALKNGKVRFVFKHLDLGKNKVKLRFLGNAYTNSAKKKVTVRVAR